MTISRSHERANFWPIWRALIGKVWQETRSRFFSAMALLTMLVVYAVLTGPGFLARYNTRFPDKPLYFSAYVWSGLFHYALQGCWIFAAFVIALGGMAREKGTAVALFTLGLPVGRLQLFLVRAATVWAESIVLGVTASLLIPLLSSFIGESYPWVQSLIFAVLMSTAGLVLLSFGLLLSEIFDAEFTAPVVGLCTLTVVFFCYKAHLLGGWNVFDVMSGTAYVDPATQMISGAPWLGLSMCLLISAGLLLTAGAVIRARDF